MKYFKIALRSDLCASDGESFGSVVDTDITFDRFGLPVIHGKALKGCLREAAEELQSFGYFPADFVGKVFGTEGGQNGALQIFDAHPANYRALLADVQDASNEFTVQQIRACYTAVRGQTALDDNGTAKKGSLRMTRVLKKGNVFYCAYELDENYQAQFEDCISCLHRIGMHRTRGLGEVFCEVVGEVPTTKKADVPTPKNGCLCYTVETLSPLIAVKSFERLPYIPGSTLLGYCFQVLGKDAMNPMLESGLHITNAYITDGEKPFYPSPAFLGRQKAPAPDENGKTPLYVFDSPACDAQNSKGDPALAYKGANIAVDAAFQNAESLSVMQEINYHHKQDDKNVGIIEGENFYQLSSLCAGQVFMGKIYGTDAQLQDIAEKLGEHTEVSFGYYRSGGYGQCKLRPMTPNTAVQDTETDLLAVYLHSAAILYDENGMPCASPAAMKAAVQAWLPDGVQIRTEEKQYLRYTEIGGYNTTWGLHKPSFQCYGGGTVFVYRLERKVKPADLAKKPPFLGERTREGYGEFSLLDMAPLWAMKEDQAVRLSKAAPRAFAIDWISAEKTECWELPSDIMKRQRHEEDLRKLALESALLKNPSESDKPIVAKMMMLLRDAGDYHALCRLANEAYDQKDAAAKAKGERAQEWLKLPEGVAASEYRIYLTALLTQAKYKLRQKGE